MLCGRCVVASKCYKASNMCVLNPHVHVLGEDAAVIAYTTLTQHLDKLVLCSSNCSSSSSSCSSSSSSSTGSVNVSTVCGGQVRSATLTAE